MARTFALLAAVLIGSVLLDEMETRTIAKLGLAVGILALAQLWSSSKSLWGAVARTWAIATGRHTFETSSIVSDLETKADRAAFQEHEQTGGHLYALWRQAEVDLRDAVNLYEEMRDSELRYTLTPGAPPWPSAAQILARPDSAALVPESSSWLARNLLKCAEEEKAAAARWSVEFDDDQKASRQGDG